MSYNKPGFVLKLEVSAFKVHDSFYSKIFFYIETDKFSLEIL